MSQQDALPGEATLGSMGYMWSRVAMETGQQGALHLLKACGLCISLFR